MLESGDARSYDAVVVGGGFYGASVAIYLKEVRKFSNVLIVEAEATLMSRASKNNQARVHNGLHYPRSLSTGYGSGRSYKRFIADWPSAIFSSFDHIYAISSVGSKVSPKQFEAFAKQIGGFLEPIDVEKSRLFNPRLVASAYHVNEVAFNADVLRTWALEKVKNLGIEVILDSKASFARAEGVGLAVGFEAEGAVSQVNAKYVFNCTYSGLASWGSDLISDGTALKHELTEMALVEMPSGLAGLGFTVMDGPFFSVMPFPSRELNTFSHVRYTPHTSWLEDGISPYSKLKSMERTSRFEYMRRDASRFVPQLASAKYVESMFEVKTVLEKSEVNDSRPILFTQHQEKPGLYSVLGGKIDNIYDVLERLDSEELTPVNGV